MQIHLKSLAALTFLVVAGCATSQPPARTTALPAVQQQIGEQPMLLIPTRAEPADLHGAASEGARVTLNVKGGKSDLTTEVNTFCTRRNLYITFRCGESAPDKLVVQPKDIWNRDEIELFIEPEENLAGKPYHHVIVDAGGQAMFERGHVYPRHFQLRASEQPWKPDAEIAVSKTEDAWVCALRIPLADLHIGEHAKAGGLWRVNFCRSRPGRDKEPGTAWSWSNLGPNGFQAPSRFGYAIPASYGLYDLQTRIAALDAAAPRDTTVEGAAKIAADPKLLQVLQGDIMAAIVSGDERRVSAIQEFAYTGDAVFSLVMDQITTMKVAPEMRGRQRNLEYIVGRDRPDEDPLPPSLQQHIARFVPHVAKDAQDHTLGYRLFTPKIDQGKRYPLVVFLHGSAEKGGDNLRQLFGGGIEYGKESVQRRHPCFVIVPQCPLDSSWSTRDPNTEKTPGKWNYRMTETPGYVALMLHDALEKTLAENPAIDPQRVYIAGSSMGGYGTYEMLLRWPEKFAAAVVLCGGGDDSRAATIANVPLWVHHGVLDDRVPVLAARTMVEALKKAGGNPKYTEYPDRGHALGEPNMDGDVLDWMFAQRRK